MAAMTPRLSVPSECEALGDTPPLDDDSRLGPADVLDEEDGRAGDEDDEVCDGWNSDKSRLDDTSALRIDWSCSLAVRGVGARSSGQAAFVSTMTCHEQPSWDWATLCNRAYSIASSHLITISTCGSADEALEQCAALCVLCVMSALSDVCNHRVELVSKWLSTILPLHS